MNLLSRREHPSAPSTFTPTIVGVDAQGVLDVVHTDETVDEIAAAIQPTSFYEPSPARHPKFNVVEATQFLADWDTNKTLPVNDDLTVQCPYCPRELRGIAGWGPHRQSHRTEAEKVLGLPITPPRVGRISNAEIERRKNLGKPVGVTTPDTGRRVPVTYELVAEALMDGPQKVAGICDYLDITETLDRKAVGNRLRTMMDRGIVRRLDGGKGSGSQMTYELVSEGGRVEHVPREHARTVTDVSVPEGLAAVLSYSLGSDAVLPISRVLDVHGWLNESERFIESLRQ